MVKHTLKILWCPIAKFLKYVWPFYNIMHERVKMPSLNAVYYGPESVSSLGPKIWEILPDSFQNMESVEAFKRAIKT